MGYEPIFVSKLKEKNDLGIQCPFKFSLPDGCYKDCIQQSCALWMYKQRACAFNVIARKIGKIDVEKIDRM